MAWMTESTIAYVRRAETKRRTLDALGLTVVRRFFGLDGKILTPEDITAKLQNIDPSANAETISRLQKERFAVLPFMTLDCPIPTLTSDMEYRLEEVINPETGEKRYQMQGIELD